MQDLEKNHQVRSLCEAIISATEYYEYSHAHPIYFDYDGVTSLLEQAKSLLRESARCPRPADLPPGMPWDERLADGDTHYDPFVYAGTMTYEDYMAASAACLADDRLDESEDFEI